MSTEARREVGELLTDELTGLDERVAAWLQQCGSCDAGLGMSCTCPDSDPRNVIAALLEQRDQARRFAVACEGEAARLEAERDDLILRLERARAELSQVKDAACCWRCGGTA